jgi:hypothetical protein
LHWETDSPFLQGDLPRVYEDYVAGYGKRLRTLSSTSETFNEFRKVKEQSSLCGNHTLSSLLITPIQRIPRYILLLKELQRSTPKTHPDSEILSSALESFEALAVHLDKVKNSADTKEKIQPILHEILKKADPHLTRIINNGQIETTGDILVWNSHDREMMPAFCILFVDTLVCCVKVKNQLKLRWYLSLTSSHISLKVLPISQDIIQRFNISPDCLCITELCTIDRDPWTEERSVYLYASKVPPYDVGFWYNSIEASIHNLWVNQKGLLRCSNRFKQYEYFTTFINISLNRFSCGSFFC